MRDLKAGPMRSHNYETPFKLDHMLKDVLLCSRDAGRRSPVRVRSPRTGKSSSRLGGRGLGDADFAALIEVLEGQAGFRL